jgi:hypothetical protein
MSGMQAVALSALIATLAAGCGSAALSPPAEGATAEPAPERMSLARPVSGKIGAPVDVRYEFDGTPAPNRPTTLSLAVVPRVSGRNLRVEFPATKGLDIRGDTVPLSSQKADAAGVFRRTLVVTPLTAAADEFRVLVSLDVGGGRYFGIHSIPLTASAVPEQQVTPRKQPR